MSVTREKGPTVFRAAVPSGTLAATGTPTSDTALAVDAVGKKFEILLWALGSRTGTTDTFLFGLGYSATCVASAYRCSWFESSATAGVAGVAVPGRETAEQFGANTGWQSTLYPTGVLVYRMHALIEVDFSAVSSYTITPKWQLGGGSTLVYARGMKVTAL